MMSYSFSAGYMKSIGALVLTLGAMIVASPAHAQQKIDFRRAVAPDVSVRISGAFSALRIVAWNKDTVQVVGSVPKGARLDGGFAGKASEPSRGGKMYVETTDGAPAGTLELRVPAGARVWAKGGTATIEVSGMTGGLDLFIVGGVVRVNASPRELNVESMDGAITIDGSPAWVRAKTATGDITMRGGSPDAAFSTVSGTVRVSDGSFERARLESVSGALIFAGDGARTGTVTFDSHSGAIELALTRKASFEVDATTVTGTIDNQFGHQRPVSGREGRGQELGLTTGMGGSRFQVRSFKGTITVRAR